MKTMKTQPSSITTWNYSPTRGFLLNKRYRDNKGPGYTYTPAGRLKTRSWARGVTATFTYDPAGDVAGVTYSDSTPALNFERDRLGRIRRFAGSTTSEISLTAHGVILAEQMDSLALGYRHRAEFGYDSLRRQTAQTNLALGAVHEFAYDAASRLAGVREGGLAVSYRDLANTSLPEHAQHSLNGTNVMTVAWEHDFAERLLAVTATAGTTPVASTRYRYDPAGQRVAATNLDQSYWLFAHDALGQIGSGRRYWDGGIPVAGQQFQYTFDAIGNRKSAQSGGDTAGQNLRTSTYTVNPLNQYTSRTAPGYVEVNGSAESTAQITVNGTPALRQGDYYRRELPVKNNTANVRLAVTNQAVGGGSTSSVTRVVTVVKSPETFTHDADGNLTGDGLWTYTWDAENRLVRMEGKSTAVAAEDRLRLNFDYDHLGRRLRKQVGRWDPTANRYQLMTSRLFFYQGWNLVGEVDEITGQTQTYLWGRDLSGSLEGAGGAGGLLSVTIRNGAHAGIYLTAFDGNGNVVALINAATGEEAARYEYGPFGEPLRATGTLAKLNPFRFSTKYTDDETGLLYYGHRYYNPATGRWLSRDPIEEEGGINLYGFVGNQPTMGIDLLGLDGYFFDGTDNT